LGGFGWYSADRQQGDIVDRSQAAPEFDKRIIQQVKHFFGRPAAVFM
jgi:hypothetical protein